MHLPEHKITVIYEAADPIFLTQPSPAHITSTLARLGVKRPFLFYIGGLEKRKNVRFLIDAHCKAKTNSQLVIGGGKPEEIAVLTSEYASSLDKLQFLGWVGDADLSSLYAGAQALVYPSLYEGFGLPVLEAMAAELPIVATTVGAIPDILENGVSGWLIKPAHPEQISERILWFHTHRDSMSQFGSKAKQRVRERFTLDALLTKYRQLFRAIIDKKTDQIAFD